MAWKSLALIALEQRHSSSKSVR